MLFSQRKGLKPVKTVMQIDSMDESLRTGLWNISKLNYWDSGIQAGYLRYDDNLKVLMVRLWHLYFRKALDSLEEACGPSYRELREYFFQCEWNEAFDFLEFVANNYPSDTINTQFMEMANDVLQQEMSAYRFVGGMITQITSGTEIEAIETALRDTDRLRPVNAHLRSALDKLSDRVSPDYRNSIKESISAIESICNLIGGSKSELSEALKAIETKVSLHGALRKAFTSLYGYTSDSSGIRHALLEEPTLDFEDAKFMLVSRSGFVNYLLAKAAKAGIRL
jgi:hypothetical protein